MPSHHLNNVGAHIYFYSGGRGNLKKLSNLYSCDVVYDNIMYPSIEHAFQAFLIPQNFRTLLSVDGPYGSFDGMTTILCILKPKWSWERVQEEMNKKLKYWGKRECVGIVAKMFTHEKVFRFHGIRRNNVTVEDIDTFFSTVIMEKYKQLEFKKILIETGDKYLCEFDKSAYRKYETGDISRWGGMIKDSILYGHNQTGIYLMRIRARLHEEHSCI